MASSSGPNALEFFDNLMAVDTSSGEKFVGVSGFLRTARRTRLVAGDDW